MVHDGFPSASPAVLRYVSCLFHHNLVPQARRGSAPEISTGVSPPSLGPITQEYVIARKELVASPEMWTFIEPSRVDDRKERVQARIEPCAKE